MHHDLPAARKKLRAESLHAVRRMARYGCMSGHNGGGLVARGQDRGLAPDVRKAAPGSRLSHSWEEAGSPAQNLKLRPARMALWVMSLVSEMPAPGEVKVI